MLFITLFAATVAIVVALCIAALFYEVYTGNGKNERHKKKVTHSHLKKPTPPINRSITVRTTQ